MIRLEASTLCSVYSPTVISAPVGPERGSAELRRVPDDLSLRRRQRRAMRRPRQRQTRRLPVALLRRRPVVHRRSNRRPPTRCRCQR